MKYILLSSMLLFAATINSAAQVLNVSRVTVKGSPVITQRDTMNLVSTKAYAKNKPGVRIIPETRYDSLFLATTTWTGDTIPTGAVRAAYWATVDSVLREVEITVSFAYANAGKVLTAVDMLLPTALPTPRANPAYAATTFTIPSGVGRFLLTANSAQNATITSIVRVTPSARRLIVTTATAGNFSGGYFKFTYLY